jgi:MFS family permease
VPRDLTTRVGGELRTLPRQFWLLVAGTFVYAAGVEMCYPFETLYLNQRLGLSMTSIGIIIGVTLFAGLPFQIVGGAIADRFGRRPVLILAICACMALYIGLGVARQLWVVVALLAFEAAFGWAQYLTASNAMVRTSRRSLAAPTRSASRASRSTPASPSDRCWQRRSSLSTPPSARASSAPASCAASSW